ncbi:hypothetical protein [Elizabethkingia ursingii]|nr:hypothetical protein [Elizabethkingia ursingii]
MTATSSYTVTTSFTFGTKTLKFSDYERRNNEQTGNARTVIGHIIGVG